MENKKLQVDSYEEHISSCHCCIAGNTAAPGISKNHILHYPALLQKHYQEKLQDVSWALASESFKLILA